MLLFIRIFQGSNFGAISGLLISYLEPILSISIICKAADYVTIRFLVIKTTY